MVRVLIDILRSSVTDRRGPMWPVWNGDETEWALDSCLLGHYRYVSLPESTVLKPRPAPGETTRYCPPSRSSPPAPAARPVRSTRGRSAPRTARPGTCAGFLSTRPHRRRSPGGNGCRQGAGKRQRGRCCADRAHRLAEHRGRAAATRAGPHHQRHDRQSISAGRAVSWVRRVSGRRHASGAGGLPERDAHQRSVRRHRQLGLDPDDRDQVGHRRDQQSGVRPQCTWAGRSTC